MKRRKFLKTTATVSAGAFILPRFSIAKPGGSANSKVNIAVVGAGGIAAHSYNGCKGENFVALCDVDSRRFPGEDQFPETAGARKFEDFRVMYDKMGKDIDGVCINTPDHTHFAATLAAMERGYHVITQKPLAHDIWQLRTLQKAKHRYNVITNMGNQGHTYDGIRKMREMYEANCFGQVKEIHLGIDGPHWGSKMFRKPTSLPIAEEVVPSNVNWDLWLGPAADRSYNRLYHPLSWRGFNDFGTGQFGDWFCHIGDGPVWILDLYEPTVIECVERGPAMEGMVPDYSMVRFDFPARGKMDACSMYWYDGMSNGGKSMKVPEDWTFGTPPKMGSFWFGDKANAFLDHRSNKPRFANKDEERAFRDKGGVSEKYPRVKDGPQAEWVRAIKGDGPEPGSNFDYSAPMSEVALLGVLAQRFGGRIEWDSKKVRITNRPELNEFRKAPVRAGWEMGQSLWT